MHTITKEDVRRPAVADAFYPGDPSILAKEIDQMLEEANPPTIEGELKALVCPHAGYMYSGSVAATGYKLLVDKNFSVIAIISPSHREYFPAVSVFTGKGYETPLGLVPVAEELCEKLIEKDSKIMASWSGHRDEHALEVQLPFLQRVLKDFAVIPIVMGTQDYDTCVLLGEALADVIKDQNALIIASSDLSHYHTYTEAVRIDQHTVNLVESFDEEELMNSLEKGISEACGGGPIIATMVASKKNGANKSKAILYKNSGDVTGDFTAVVGYLSAAFYKSS
ncbi:MAG: AmmeMemoRadiSam system protein B [Calditrichaeota bacterium]|nr:MAG: AmmeMemoRadiSam system protein B [Calditrichota bacterium]